MVRRILAFFGLMTMKQARHINRESVALYARNMARFVEQDFGIPPAKDQQADAIEWADECFDGIVTDSRIDVQLRGSWELSTCQKCGQVDNGQTGEYPCSECGLPQVWDEAAE